MKRRSPWPIFHCPVILPYILKTIWYMNAIFWDYESVWPDVWPKNKCRSLWPIFHAPVILPYILKTIWYMTTILWDCETVWPNVWPKYKCRSPWPIFHGPVILPYVLKTIWYMNTILRDYESVWPDVWPKNKCRSPWPIFYGPVILPYILKTIWYMNTILWDYEPYDLKINVGHCDLYFMVQWVCLMSWRLFDISTPYFGIMSQYDLMFDLKINVGHCDLPIFHGPAILPYILKTIWYMNTRLWDYDSVGPDVWPKNKCRSLWPLFHCPLILPYIFVFDGWMSYFWKMRQCNTVQWFVFFWFLLWKTF